MPLLLEGAVVRRVDLSDAAAAVEVRSPGETAVIVLGAAQGARGVGVVSSDARRAAWGTRLPAGLARARSGEAARLEGARVAGVSARAVLVDKAGELRALCVDGARVVARDVRDAADALGSEGPADEARRAEVEARGAQLLDGLAAFARARRRDAVTRVIARGLGRVERRIQATRGDLARLADAEALAAQAQWLIAEAVRAPRGARSLRVTDWTSGEPRELEIPLDPSKSAKAQVEAMFQRARRLKRGAKIAEERIAKAEVVRDALARAADDAARAEDDAALDAALARARSAAPKDVALDAGGAGGAGGARGEKNAPSAPYRAFAGAGGARVLVGKGAAQNDRLTFQVARPHDLWLHAKGRTGAHVIVPLAKNASCPGDLLIDAAHLAAHFSDARGEAVVEIQYTPRRYLRRPRGSAPGLVVVDREKVLAVRLEPGRVERLLEREE